MRRLGSQVSANIFLHVPSSVRKSSRTLVFFVPGNPGLIGYYRPFLALVARGLQGLEHKGRREHGDEHGDAERDGKEDENGDGSERSAGAEAVVVGLSLGGFDVDDEEETRRRRKKRNRDGEAQRRDGVSGEDQRKDHSESRDKTEDAVSALSLCESVVEDEELLYPPSFPLRSRGDDSGSGTQQEDCGDGPGSRNGTADDQRKIYTLREQIELSYARVEYLVRRLHEQEGLSTDISEQEQPIQVVLMGHSVGAYIALELVRLWHERHQHHLRQRLQVPLRRAVDPYGKDDDNNNNDNTTSISTLNFSSKTRTGTTPFSPGWSISTCILLTPTIQDIHLSPSGRLATPALSYLPFLPGLAQILLHTVLLGLFPSAWFSLLVSRVTGMHRGSHGLETTMAFLKSGRGVKQALSMARGEMNEIRRDTWGQEVWGASHSDTDATTTADDPERTSSRSPRLLFWFAKKDHWIADVTKEAIFKNRAADVDVQRDCLPRPQTNMEFVETEEVDFTEDHTRKKMGTEPARIQILETEAMVHAWCLNQSEFVARRVSSWLGDVLNAENSLLRDGGSSSH